VKNKNTQKLTQWHATRFSFWFFTEVLSPAKNMCGVATHKQKKTEALVPESCAWGVQHDWSWFT